MNWTILVAISIVYGFGRNRIKDTFGMTLLYFKLLHQNNYFIQKNSTNSEANP